MTKISDTLNADTLIQKTMELAIVPFQEKIGTRTLLNILKIIDEEDIIVTGRFRDSIVPKNIPTLENPMVEIASVDCPYAVHLEYGTVKMKPRAVFRRAIAMTQEALK